MEPNVTPSPILTQDVSPLFGGAGKPLSRPFPNPFVGLRPFKTEESLLFFGRNEQTIELLQRLHNTRFLAVVGSSGCGKSSLIRAGLIPKLKAGFLVEDRDIWMEATMKPGDSPLRNLAIALLEATADGVSNLERDIFVKQLRQFGVEAATTWLALALTSSSNLLLLIDQFEEIFRFGIESNDADKREEAEDFVALILALAGQKQLPIYVVLTIRSDFLGDCDNFYGLPEAMNHSQYLVPRLTRQQRQQAIEGPIRLFSSSIAPRLLDRMLNDVGDKFDQLPVMQHVLMRTWERWQFEKVQDNTHEMDLSHYEAAGTIINALSKDANSALNGMTDDELKITERLFRALIDVDENNRRIRRPMHLSRLSGITETNCETISQIIKRFSNSPRSFLTVNESREDDNPLIDISHESLIRQWNSLGEWIDVENTSREIYLRLAKAARRREKINADLYRGPDLQEALDWQEKERPNKEWARRYDEKFDINFSQAINFLKISRDVSEQELREKEKRRKRPLRILWIAVSINTILLAALIISSWLAYMRDPNYRQTIFDLYLTNQPDSNEAFVMSVAFSPDGKTLASASYDKKVRLWDTLSLKNTATLKGHEAPVLSVAFSPNGETFASASGDQTVKLWNTASRQIISSFKGHEADIRSVAFSPNGETLASASGDKTVKLWDVSSLQSPVTLKGHEAGVRSVAFSPDGKTLASASDDKTVKLWDTATWQNIATFEGHEDYVLSVAFSPDGKTIASASNDLTVRLWDIMSQQNIASLKGHKAYVLSVIFSPDGKMLASASGDQTVKLWDTISLKNIATLYGHEADVKSIAFSPNGKTIASASFDKMVKLWDIASWQNIATLKGQ